MRVTVMRENARSYKPINRNGKPYQGCKLGPRKALILANLLEEGSDFIHLAEGPDAVKAGPAIDRLVVMLKVTFSR
jgi:hypothetical protein